MNRLIKLLYKNKFSQINNDNYDKIIPKSMAYVILYFIITLISLFFTHGYIKYFSLGFLVFLMVKTYVLFVIYANYHKTKINSKDYVDTSTISKSYKLFGLEEKCSDVDIKKKYRELSKKWHPDKFSNDSLENQEIAKRNFQKVNSAYNVINNSRK